MSTNKDVKYLNKDFSSFSEDLINLAKAYYPETYNDFNETDPGMMYMDMAAYVGDVLSLYVDTNLRESLMLYAQEKKNLVALAKAFGYNPKISVPSYCKIDVYQLVPSIASGSAKVPDFNYCLSIKDGMELSSNTSLNFITNSPVNFAVSSSFDPTEITVYSLDNSNQPEYFLFKKQVTAFSATVKEKYFTFTSPKKFATALIDDDQIIGILDVTDSDGNQWNEVPFLAQDTIFYQVPNTRNNDPDLYIYSNTSPYLLKLKKISKRFVSRVTSNNNVELQFGSGISNLPDEEIIPNPDNVGSPLILGNYRLDRYYDPSNFLYTRAYGEAPSDTTLKVRYLVGGGIKSNVGSGTITKITKIEFENNSSGLNQQLYSRIVNSVACNNPGPANGGRDGESAEEIRHRALAYFSTQNRAVSKEDYLIRVYSLPSQFGSIAKAYIVQDEQINIFQSNTPIRNPLTLNLYCLGYDANKNLTVLNSAVKENLKTYLSQYKMLTDSINIKDGYVVNFGVYFEAIVLPGFNHNEILINCIYALKEFFNIDKWSINQPIIKGDVINVLLKVKGVQNVTSLKIRNKYGGNYSNIFYDMEASEQMGIIYPSLDPCIFEIKYPDTDIKGRIVTI